MGKRIYCETNRKLYQFKADGKIYCRLGGDDVCLDTNDPVVAEANLALELALRKRFGTVAFKFKVKDLFPKFLKEKKPDLRESTFKSYETIWKDFNQPLGKHLIGNMNQRAWAAYCTKKRGKSDFQNHRNLMHQFLVWCEMKEFILAVPTLKNPKHKRRRRKIIPPQHLRMIFQHAHGSLLLFISMALFMGMRRSEIMGLEWPRLDLIDRLLILRDEDVKTDEGREIPINTVAHQLLLVRKQKQQDENLNTRWVFPHATRPSRHANFGGLMNPWRVCLLRCGLAKKAISKGKMKHKIVVEYTWHDLRATYEKYSHKSTKHTDTQREKMVGADIDVQRKRYVSMNADDLRGLEEVVSTQIPELAAIVGTKFLAQTENVKRNEIHFGTTGYEGGGNASITPEDDTSS